MLKRTVVIAGFTLMALACNNDPAPTEQDMPGDTLARADTGAYEQPVNEQKKGDGVSGQCFAKMSANDTVVLRFITNDTLVQGSLTYRYNEKDKNEGTITGVLRGDTLIADYNFISEGINSVRQVIFLKRNNRFIEGFGNVVDDHGKMVFENTAALKFDESLTLQAIDCARVAHLQK